MIFAVDTQFKQLRKRSLKKNSGFSGIRTRDLCDTGAVLYQLSYEAITVGSRSILVNLKLKLTSTANQQTRTSISIGLAATRAIQRHPFHTTKRRICSKKKYFDNRTRDLHKILLERGYKIKLIEESIMSARRITRDEALVAKTTNKVTNRVPLVVTYNRAIPNLRKIVN